MLCELYFHTSKGTQQLNLKPGGWAAFVLECFLALPYIARFSLSSLLCALPSSLNELC